MRASRLLFTNYRNDVIIIIIFIHKKDTLYPPGILKLVLCCLLSAMILMCLFYE